MLNKHSNLSFFDHKNILITGAGGYIGSTFARALSGTQCHLTLLTRQTGDITDETIWKPLLKNTDMVFHFAGQTSSGFAKTHPIQDLSANVLPIISMIETCRAHGYSPTIIYAGTVTQVGMTTSGRINESMPDKPVTVYDINKLTAEKYLQYYSQQLGGEAVTLRLANIYGPGPESSKPDRGVTNLMIKKALKNEPITIFGNGKYLRDYVYIDDVVNAFLKAAIHIDKTSGNYYVIGTGRGHTVLQMATSIKKAVKSIMKTDTRIVFAPFPPNTSEIEFRNFTADSTAFHKVTGWKATLSLDEGIGKTVQYIRKLL